MPAATRKYTAGEVADADARALRQLSLLIVAGLACTIFIVAFLILAAMQAVGMIDEAARDREILQVARAVAAAPGGMNEITLAAMADTLDLDAARLTTTAAVTPAELVVPIATGGDRVVAWTPHLFGSRTFETVAPFRIASGAVFVLMVALIGWRVTVVGSRLDRRRAAASRLANTDALTGLGNRLAFDNGLATRYAAAGSGGPGFVLVSFDLDDFKAINDVHGHAAGDLVLQFVADTLRQAGDADDLAARIGGDEFAVLRSGEGLDVYLDRVKMRLADGLELGGRRLAIAASVGLARSEDFPGSSAQLLQAADIALYRAKRNGPGNAELAVPPPAPRRAA